jgi:hypothetical protein
MISTKFPAPSGIPSQWSVPGADRNGHPTPIETPTSGSSSEDFRVLPGCIRHARAVQPNSVIN